MNFIKKLFLTLNLMLVINVQALPFILDFETIDVHQFEISDDYRVNELTYNKSDINEYFINTFLSEQIKFKDNDYFGISHWDNWKIKNTDIRGTIVPENNLSLTALSLILTISIVRGKKYINELILPKTQN